MNLRLENFKAAIADFDAAFRLRRNWEKPILNRASAWYYLGDAKAATADYEFVLQLNPNNSEATNGLGLVRQHLMGDLGKAEEYYQKALFQNPNNAGAWFNMAFIEAGRGEKVKAVEDFGQAIRLDTNYVEAHINRGILEMQMQRQKEAVLDFQFAAKRRPNDGRMFMLLGWAQCEVSPSMQGCLTLARAKELGEKGAEELIQKFCN